MSDYLSHLARVSGISVGKPPAAGGGASHAPVATPSPAGEPAPRGAGTASPEPPHVEHVTFVEQPRGAAGSAGEFEGAGGVSSRPEREDTGTSSTGREEGPAIRWSWREDARPRASHDATHQLGSEPESSSAAREVRPAWPAPEEGGVRHAGRTMQGARRPESISSDATGESDDSARASSPARTHAGEETVLVAPRESSQAPGAGQAHHRTDAPDARAPSSPDPAGPHRAYLREVVEWISAPPPARTDDEEERVRARRGAGEADGSRAAATVEIVNERKAASAARAEAERGPEVDDFTLTIGSIHVVVEEPQGQVNAQPAPQSPASAQGARAAGGDGDGVSRLRRHYIRI